MLVLQLYILLQRVSFFCAIFWICSFIDPYIKKQDYKVLLFAYVYDTNDEEKEKLLAWLTHAKYWRDSHKPLEREIPDRYEKIKISKIDSRKDCSVWKTEDAIMNFLMDIT